MRSINKRSVNCLRLCLAVFIFFAAAPVFAGSTADREVLANGMVLLHSERNSLPIVRVVMAIKAGSVVEPAGKAGLANLTADLLSEGTTSRSSQDISDAIEFIGGELAASGGSDYITVTLSVLKKDVATGFDLLSDIVLNPSFSNAEIQRRKALIKNSIIQQKDEPDDVAEKAFKKAVFGDHPYGRPVEGTEESIDGITREDILNFYKAYYKPNSAIISVVGDISRDDLQSLLDKYFQGWEGRRIHEKPLPALKPSEGVKAIKIDKDLTQASVILGHVGIKREDPDYYAVSVMNYILGGGGFASRLMDNIRDNRGLSYDVRSLFSAGKYAGSFQASLQTKNSAVGIAIGEVLKEMERMRSGPVTDKELFDAKAYLTGSLPLRIDSTRKMAGFLINAEYYNLGLDYIDTYKKRIGAVTKEDVQRVAKKYLDTKNYFLVVVGNLRQMPPIN